MKSNRDEVDYLVKIDKIHLTKRWYKITDEPNYYNQLHNEYGPAVEYGDGDKSWYLNAIEYPGPFTDKEWQAKVELINNPPIKELTLSEVIKELGYNVKIIK